MEPTTAPLRERLARDIFLADNSNASEEHLLKEWAENKEARPISIAYCYVIADGLIAKGWRRVQWAA